jgi:Uma2 family endonuclease
VTPMLADSGLTWADVLRTWSELEVPEGWRPEITPGGITMTPPPSGEHNLIVESSHHILRAALDGDFGVFQSQGVGVASTGGIFIPDLCVVAREHIPRGTEPVNSEHVVLAVEVTSRSNARHDRKRKRWAYAHGGIAQYLLIDAYDEHGPTISLFSNPVDGDYRNMVRSAFGQIITLAAPVKADLDSGLFPTR